MRQVQAQQEAMMRRDAPVQGVDDGRRARPSAARGSGRPDARGPLAVDDGLKHGASTHAQDVAEDARELQVGVLEHLLDAQRMLGDLRGPVACACA